MSEDFNIVKFFVKGVIAVVAFILMILLITPIYHVWDETKAGEAELSRAEYNRQIATLEAKQKLESSRSLADAEVVRAEGVAKANKIIGDSLKENEGYLRYLYITHLSESEDKTVIYIPTEAGLPILESQRLRK